MSGLLWALQELWWLQGESESEQGSIAQLIAGNFVKSMDKKTTFILSVESRNSTLNTMTKIHNQKYFSLNIFPLPAIQ